MTQRVSDTFGLNPPKEVTLLLRLLDNVVLTDEAYRAFVTGTLGKSHNFAQRKPLLELGHFSTSDLCTMLIEMDAERAGVNLPTVLALLKQMMDWGL